MVVTNEGNFLHRGILRRRPSRKSVKEDLRLKPTIGKGSAFEDKGLVLTTVGPAPPSSFADGHHERIPAVSCSENHCVCDC